MIKVYLLIFLSALFLLNEAFARPNWQRDEAFKIKRIRLFSSEEEKQTIAKILAAENADIKCGYNVSLHLYLCQNNLNTG